jgi:hypothetical protein
MGFLEYLPLIHYQWECDESLHDARIQTCTKMKKGEQVVREGARKVGSEGGRPGKPSQKRNVLQLSTVTLLVPSPP